MKKLRGLSRGAIANVMAASGLASLVAGAWSWCSLAGFVGTGAALLVAGWAVDE